MLSHEENAPVFVLSASLRPGQQIHYIITKLLNAGLIVREGGQGNRNTIYRVAQ